jgi:methionyl-tRNA synthetase
LKKNDNKLGSDLEENLIDVFKEEAKLIFKDYLNLDYSNACKRIMKLADSANQYIDQNQPWVLAKEKINDKEVIKISSTSMNLFRILNICLEPIIPETAFKIRKYLNLTEDNFEHVTVSVKNHQIQSFKPLIERIEDDKIVNLIEASKSG